MKNFSILFGLLLFALSCKTSRKSPSVFAKAQTFQLAKPILKIDSVFFKKAATISIEMNHPETEIFFSAKDIYGMGFLGKATESITISDRKTIAATAHHPDFLKSETATAEVVKVNSLAAKTKISLTPKPNETYPGHGAASLTDLKKGSFQFRKGNWLGFVGDTIQIDLKFPKKESLSSVGISFLEDNDSWIFLPKSIEILSGGKVIAENVFPIPISGKMTEFKFVVIPFSEEKTDSISIRILNLEGIPNWHPGKNLPSWLFIDEVFLNTYVPFKLDR